VEAGGWRGKQKVEVKVKVEGGRGKLEAEPRLSREFPIPATSD